MSHSLAEILEGDNEVVHFSSKSGALFVETGASKPTSPAAGGYSSLPGGESKKPKFKEPVASEDDVYGDIAMWGSNNKLPQELQADIEKTGVLTAGIGAKARIAIGKGPKPAVVSGITDDGYETLQFILDEDIHDWMERNNSFTNSYKTTVGLFSYGNAWLQILTNADRTEILAYKCMDSTECRFEKMDKQGRINNVLVSSDWDKYNNATADKDYIKTIPLLDRDFPYEDLVSRKSGNVFMMAIQYPLNGRKYYAPSPWGSAKKWVKIAQGIPEMKEAMFKNQMTLKYLIEIHVDFWNYYDPAYANADVATKQKIRDGFYEKVEENLVGGENSFKSIFVPMRPNAATGELESLLKIELIEDKQKDGKFTIDSISANIEILLPLMINAALLGVDMPSGSGAGGNAGSGSDIREAYLVQIMLLELERMLNNSFFDLVKRVNGWGKKYKMMRMAYPNQMLTTLNTGKNTQSTS